jgi:hypothetical protein
VSPHGGLDAVKRLPNRVQQLGLLLMLTALIVYAFAQVGW